MDALLKSVFDAILAGGPQAIIAILAFGLIGSVLAIKALLKKINEKELIIMKKEEKNEKLLQNYYEGNKTLTDALNSIYIALIEIKSKL